jgi:PEGA domain
VRHDTISMTYKLIFCAAVLLAEPTGSQTLPALGRLHITSASPGAPITINGRLRPESTPITLAVMPQTYKVRIGSCAEQSVSVRVGATATVSCPPINH